MMKETEAGALVLASFTYTGEQTGKRGTAMTDNDLIKEELPKYKMTTRKGISYYRTRIKDADGKRVAVYGKTPEELEEKLETARKIIENAVFRKNNPTVKEYSEKWLMMRSAGIMEGTARSYRYALNKYIIAPLGDMYMTDVTADDIKMAMVPVSRLSSHVYNTVNMLVKSIFSSAQYSYVIEHNPAKNIPSSGGKPAKERQPLTDEQVRILLDTVRDLPSYTFVMIALYAGLRREEILALKWDCVFLDCEVSYISVRRAWRRKNNRPDISTRLKSKAAHRDIPIPKCLAACLREEKAKSNSEYVISDSEGNPLSDSQYSRLWNYIRVRQTKERTIRRYVNGQVIRHTLKPMLGEESRTKKGLFYTIDFEVTPHVLRHTYITNLIYAGVDPKTVQYLAGHENSKVTMDIYAKAKYNKPQELSAVVRAAFDGSRNPEKRTIASMHGV